MAVDFLGIYRAPCAVNHAPPDIDIAPLRIKVEQAFWI
jgi:hypothetical protein